MKRLVKNKAKLSERCFEYNVSQSQEVMKEVSETLLEYFHKHEDVKALTSNQFGYNCRVIGIRFEDGIKFFVNPMFMKQKGLHVVVESNISLPDRKFLVARNTEVEVAFQDLFGFASSIAFENADPVGDLFQQLIQMLDGVQLDDIGLEVFDDFFEAPEDEQEEVIQLYLDSLKTSAEAINKEIQEDHELAEIQEGIDFLTAAAKGEVQIKQPKLSNKKQRVLDKLTKKLRTAGHNYTKKKKKRK